MIQNKFTLAKVPASKLPLYLVGAMVLILLVSFLVYNLQKDYQVRRILYYPTKTFAKQVTEVDFGAEVHLLPRQNSLEKEIRELIEELILGPVQPEHTAYLSSDVVLYAVMNDGGTVLLNFSLDLMEKNIYDKISLEQKVALVKEAVTTNFRQVKACRVFIEGAEF